MVRAFACASRWALLALAGCTPIVDAKFPDVEITRPDISVPAAGIAGSMSVPFSFTFDSSKLGSSSNPANQEEIAEVDLDQLTLSAKSGVSDLSFIESLHVVAYVPTNTVDAFPSDRQVEIADYQRRGNAPIGAIFSVPLPEPVDLLPLLQPDKSQQRKIVVSFNLGGKLPNTAWTTDIAMSLSVELKE
jgi:hypothetical protein